MTVDDLCSLTAAAAALGLADDDLDGLAEAIDEHAIRTVTFAGNKYLLGADVQRALDDRDPRKLAAKVPRR
jgi:hypothetical protein